MAIAAVTLRVVIIVKVIVKNERDVSHHLRNAIIGLIWLKLNVETAPVSNPIVTDGPTMQDISQCLIEYILPNQWPSIALPWCTLPSWPNIMWCLFSPVIHDFMSALCKYEFKSGAWNHAERFDDYGHVLNLVMVNCKSNLFDFNGSETVSISNRNTLFQQTSHSM